ncbi:MAG: three-Cys-motif partner protein TcmP, partial [Cyclobacteriaceae bacterium]
MTEQFFDEQTEQSLIKTKIVATYFEQWAKVITGYQRSRKTQTKIGYIDLFAGPGRYKDGTTSTPLLILNNAVNNSLFRDSLVTTFNDADEENSSSLKQEIEAINGIDKLKYPPNIMCGEVGDEIVEAFEELDLCPTLMFVDPWGYKGLSLRLINSVLKDWACECIFFFNYNRINMGASNDYVKKHIDALFSEERAEKLRPKLQGQSPDVRELIIVEELTQALKDMGGQYVLPFRFRNSKGSRTSHHLFFVSKHPLG